jgi:hypothetical protein
LAVQEVGEPEALRELADAASGHWYTSTADPDARGIRVGFLSRLELNDVVQFADFPPGLHPVQVDDTDAAATTWAGPPCTPASRSQAGRFTW